MRKIRPPEEGEVLPGPFPAFLRCPGRGVRKLGGVPALSAHVSAPGTDRVRDAIQFFVRPLQPAEDLRRALPAVLAGHVALVHLLGQQALAGL